jgi:hypothetical protein
MTVTVERPATTTIPRELAELFRPHTDLLAKAVIYEIQCTIAEYARPLDDAFGECVTRSVQQAIRYTVLRAGGRVAWRHLAELGQARGVSSGVMCACAEAIFAYVDEMSALSIEGYRSLA